MPVHPRSRAAARGLLSLALLSGIGLERVSRAAEPSDRRAQPSASKPAPATGTEAEGIVHIWRSPEPEGFVSLRHMPHVGRWIAWLMPGGFAVAAAPAAPASPNKESRSPEELRQELLKLSGRRSLPVMVAPLDSCAPVDVGRIEDLIFPDPATADRIIRAAGQGFRVVVLSPVADPTPNLHSQDCPRPSAADQPTANHPEPTPVAFEREGRVRISRPFGSLPAAPPVPAAPAPELFTDAIPILKKLPNLTQIYQTDPKLLVPHPVPTSQGLPHFVVGEAPVTTGPDLSPSEHLRLAARQLDERGLTEEAEDLRNKAKELERHVESRLAAIAKQQQALAAEAAKLKRLVNSARQVLLRAEIVEVNVRRLGSKEGVALLRQHLGEKFDEAQPLLHQLPAAAVSPGFLRDAGQHGILTRLSSPTIVTMEGREAEVQIGTEVLLPAPKPGSEKFQTRDVGIRLSVIPSQVDGNRLRLDVTPSVERVDWPNAVDVAGRLVPGIQTRVAAMQITLSPGQPVAIGGFAFATPFGESQKIQQAAAEEPRSRDLNYETLFIITPERISHPDEESPHASKPQRHSAQSKE